MQKRRPGEGGADLHCGDRRDPTSTRPVLQGNAVMALRLAALRFADREVQHG